MVVFLLSLDLLVVAPVVAALIGLAITLPLLTKRHERGSAEAATPAIRPAGRVQKVPVNGQRPARAPTASARR